jgi:predicted neuraminidase
MASRGPVPGHCPDEHHSPFAGSSHRFLSQPLQSNDGCAWATPQATQLPNNNASIQAIRLKNGHLLMIFNNSQAELKPEHADTGPRSILSIAISEDDGKTWPWIRDIENPKISQPILPLEDPEYSYPSLTQSSDGEIHVAHTFRRETIKYMTFTEDWIRHGSTMGGKPQDAHHEGVAILDRSSLVPAGAIPGVLPSVGF